MPKIRNPHHPWSAERLVRLSKTLDFESDVDKLEEADGEPFIARAQRRLEAAMSAWRDTHPPMRDPIFDDSLASFHVKDVAALLYECQRLLILEEKVIRALVPPSKRMRYDRKLDKFVDDEGAPDDD